MNIIEITDLSAPELAPYTRLTEAQLRNKLEPEKGIFIAESPKVIGTALDAGCEPLSFLMERRQIDGPAAGVLARCPDAAVYTADRSVLQALTGYALTLLLVDLLLLPVNLVLFVDDFLIQRTDLLGQVADLAQNQCLLLLKLRFERLSVGLVALRVLELLVDLFLLSLQFLQPLAQVADAGGGGQRRHDGGKRHAHGDSRAQQKRNQLFAVFYMLHGLIRSLYPLLYIQMLADAGGGAEAAEHEAQQHKAADDVVPDAFQRDKRAAEHLRKVG